MSTPNLSRLNYVTVGELKAQLASILDDYAVVITWENTDHSLLQKHLEINHELKYIEWDVEYDQW